MKRTNKTGCTCVGELRLSPLDVGFDLRQAGLPVSLPDAFSSVGIEENGEVFLVEGTRDEMVAAIRAAGYTVKVSEREAFAWARDNQGFAGSWEDWQTLDAETRRQYELGAAGIPTESE